MTNQITEPEKLRQQLEQILQRMRTSVYRALDGFMRYYNTERPHQGYRVRGRTPGALVWGVAAAQ